VVRVVGLPGTSRTFTTTIVRDGATCFIPVPFDPRQVFGKVRAPVTVSLRGYTYRSTIASMGDGPCIPLRRSNRLAAGLDGGERVEVTLARDSDERAVEPPEDLVAALVAAKVWPRWKDLAYTHQREHVEAVLGAKKPETRARRIARAVAAVGVAPVRRRKA
jgi:hypothetical protein